MTVFLPLFETTDKLLPVQIGRRSFQAHTLESRIPPTPSETSSVIWVPCRKREADETTCRVFSNLIMTRMAPCSFKTRSGPKRASCFPCLRKQNPRRAEEPPCPLGRLVGCADQALEVLWSDRIWIWSPTPTCDSADWKGFQTVFLLVSYGNIYYSQLLCISHTYDHMFSVWTRVGTICIQSISPLPGASWGLLTLPELENQRAIFWNRSIEL